MRPVAIPEAFSSELLHIRNRFSNKGPALMPALSVAEKHFGWLSPEALVAVARGLDLPQAVVRGVASFYSMYRHRPMGKYIIMLCTNISCTLLGADEILKIIQDRYGISPGETTLDGRFTLVEAECLGQCDGAPAMMVGDDVRSGLTPANVLEILESYL